MSRTQFVAFLTKGVAAILDEDGKASDRYTDAIAVKRDDVQSIKRVTNGTTILCTGYDGKSEIVVEHGFDTVIAMLTGDVPDAIDNTFKSMEEIMDGRERAREERRGRETIEGTVGSWEVKLAIPR